MGDIKLFRLHAKCVCSHGKLSAERSGICCIDTNRLSVRNVLATRIRRPLSRHGAGPQLDGASQTVRARIRVHRGTIKGADTDSRRGTSCKLLDSWSQHLRFWTTRQDSATDVDHNPRSANLRVRVRVACGLSFFLARSSTRAKIVVRRWCFCDGCVLDRQLAEGPGGPDKVAAGACDANPYLRRDTRRVASLKLDH